MNVREGQPVPGLAVRPEAFVFVGMAAFVVASLRSPLTGIVFVIEMTGGSTLLLPLLAGCFGSILAAETLRDAPIHETLKARTAKSVRRCSAVLSRKASET